MSIKTTDEQPFEIIIPRDPNLIEILVMYLFLTELIKFYALNSSWKHQSIIDEPFYFTSDYELRIYTSGLLLS